MRFKKVCIFYNRRSGPGFNRFSKLQDAFAEHWHPICDDICWYFPESREQSANFVHKALESGADCIVVAGGDGTVSSIGTMLIGTNVPMAVIPMGSGNGLARHFSLSMSPSKAVRQLANGIVKEMDVGLLDDNPFLVTASIAWDAALVESYNSIPMRGVGSYFLAAAKTLFDYKTQPLEVQIDDTERLSIQSPILFSIGNLQGWGCGAYIDVEAKESDGKLELITGNWNDAARMIADLPIVFKVGGKALPGVTFRRFSTMSIHRDHAQCVQLDGELVDAGADIIIRIHPKKLKILVPLDKG